MHFYQLKRLFIYPVLFLCLFQINTVVAQEITVSGTVRDVSGKPLDMVSVFANGTNFGTVTNAQGYYLLQVPSSRQRIIVFSSVGYLMRSDTLDGTLNAVVDITLYETTEQIGEVNVVAETQRTTTLQRIDPKLIEVLPSASGDAISALLKTLPGVSSNNEFSSQYSVRGGNFDENLVYVNDIEIYRPFLVRGGHQEGLSFVNSDMVSSVLFSAGGFDAGYGDKMSSVLDVKYRQPEDFRGSFSVGLLGLSGHLEGVSANKKFTHLTGVRYKSLKYVLNTLDTRGDYEPAFGDIQTYLTYKLTPSFQLSFLGNVAQNQYRFAPSEQNTSFGATGLGGMSQSLGLRMFMEGTELNEYTTSLGALTAEFTPVDSIQLKLIASVYRANESETFDVLGYYSLNELDRDLSSDNFGDSVMNIGVGAFLRHARNYLVADVFSLSHKGTWYQHNATLEWGVGFQHEKISNQINEWELIDSSGYSIPYNGEEIGMHSYLHADLNLDSWRLTGYWKRTNSWTSDGGTWVFTGGVRAHFWNFSEQITLSPRLSVSFVPYWERDFLFRLSGGLYHQHAFFKELRDFDGSINKDIQAQRAIHLVFGADYNFKGWGRPFKLVGEIYAKKLDNIIPYEVDNVRVSYYSHDKAKGYVTGIDLKVNGEFVRDVDSWASLSLMQTREDIEGDKVGYIPRPTDQILSVGLFFQDYIPGNKNFTAQLNGVYGSRLPFGPPQEGRAADTLRMPSYKRVDLGFSALLKTDGVDSRIHVLNHFRSLWLTLEVFNILGIKNVVSYNWITMVPNSSVLDARGYYKYAVPNYLSDRRLNLKLTIRF